MKKALIYIIILVSWLLNGCIQENPNLVNPPSSKEKMFVRFINLAGDQKSRSLVMNGQVAITSEYGMNTMAINPPEDSVIAGVRNGSIEEFTITRKVKFMKESHNTFFALPSPYNSPNYKSIDTLIPVSSSTGLPINTVHSYLKMINVFPDSTISFSIINGCPNGNQLFGAVRYKAVTSQEVVGSGSMPVSLIRNNKEQREVLGLFDLNLLNDRQYLIIISEGIDKNVKFSLLDETTNELISLSEPNIIAEKNAYIRTINFSSEAITVKKLPDEIVSEQVQPNSIGNYDQVSACTTQGIDSLIVEYSEFSPSANALSINVNKKYTYIVSDDGKKKAGLSLVLPEAFVELPYPDKALIRVLNIAEDNSNYTLSIAARMDTSASTYSVGETIASSLKYKQLSNIFLLPIQNESYRIPLTLFANTSPAKLLTSTSFQFKGGKNYLIVIKKNSDDKEVISIIEDEQQSEIIPESHKEQFFRLVNFVSGAEFISVTLNNILNNAKVSYFTSISSVAGIGANSIKIDGKDFQFISNENQRNVLIAMGGKDNIELFDLKSDNHSDLLSNQTRYRMMNATYDISSIKIVAEKENGDIISTALAQKQTTEYKTDIKGKIYSFFFYDSSNNKLLVKANEIKLVEGKVYTIILAGDAKTGYNVYITQEF